MPPPLIALRSLPQSAREADPKALPGHVRHRAATILLTAALRDPGQAGHRIAKGLRRDRRLGSKDRPWVADALYGIVRRQRLLELLLRAGGWEGQNPGEVIWWAWLVLTAGLEPADAPVKSTWLLPCKEPEPAITAWAVGQTEEALLSRVGSVPDWLAKGLLEDRKLEEAFDELQALDGRAPVVLRVVRSRTSREAVLKELAELGVTARRGRWSPDALVIEGRVHLNGLACWRQGRVSLQDEASQVVSELIAPRSGDRVIDACAGAGGKSLTIGSRAPKGVRIVALDVRERALAEARRRARREGLDLETHVVRAQGPLPIPPATASHVLVDAPCTGSGTLRRHPGLRWRWGEVEAEAFSGHQRALLERHAPLVAPGGLLVYATCSLWRRENQHVVEDFMEDHPDWELVPVEEILGSPRASALSQGGVLVMTPAKHGTDGFFAAVLTRSRAL